MFLFLFGLTSAIQGLSGYNFHLMDTSAYNRYPPDEGYNLLVNDGGTVYNNINSETGKWLCRMLGYQSYSGLTTKSYSWMQSFPVRYYALVCSDSVVPQCRYREYRSSYSGALWIKCNARTQYGDSTSFYLVDKDKQHTQKGHGLLMYNGGTVSGNKFDDSTAELICSIMGYTGVMGWNIGRKYKFQENLPIRHNDLNCLTRDRAFPLCTYGTNTTGSNHEEDVWLWCDIPRTSNLVCPPGNRRVGSDKCSECSANTYSPDPSDSSSCLSCPTNSTSLAGSTYCSCAEDTFMNTDDDKCVECPDNSTSLKGSTFCSCIGGMYLYSDYRSCVPCPFGTVSREGSMVPGDCVPCPAMSLSLNDGKACSCEKGYGWEWGDGKDGLCKACPENFYKDKDHGTCIRCPHEATSSPLSEDCRCPSGLSWDGKSCVDCSTQGTNSGACTCQAGTFWSEGSSQCEPCPENHFSGRFSSVCSKCPIYSVSPTKSPECTSCPKGYSWENYSCTKCPGNHVGNGATCSLCPEGTSPSKDKTICQKSAIDALSVSSMVLCILFIAMVTGNIIFTWRERRARIVLENVQMSYQSHSATDEVKIRGRRCMCPACPCSEPAKPPLPERGGTLHQDDVYANFS